MSSQSQQVQYGNSPWEPMPSRTELAAVALPLNWKQFLPMSHEAVCVNVLLVAFFIVFIKKDTDVCGAHM